jgi:uncharacterized membrane protein
MGALGALVKDILKDNCIILPKVADGKFYMGILGGLIIGAIAGYVVDNDPITAFLGGFTGYQIINSLVSQTEEAKKVKAREDKEDK